MALSASHIWEVETTGSDTLNGGGFDPSKVSGGGFTDGAAISANTNAPVFSSASYNFVAGDVGAWVYINSGTNWTPGWYKIASVAANAATLNGTIGQAVLAVPIKLSTVIGCATVASPTGATWSIDYSQQAAAAFTYTDLVSAGTGLTVSSAAKPFGRQQVGNAIVITGGTNFNTGRYVIASVAAVTFIATVVGPTNITTGAGASGTGGLGGALATPGAASLLITVAGQQLYIKAGTYTIASATPNIATGCIAPTVNCLIEGYQTVRDDLGTAPLLQASGISTFTIVTTISSGDANAVINISVDGATLTSSRGFAFGGSSATSFKLSAINCTNSAFVQASIGTLSNCVATGCTTQPAFLTSAGHVYACIAYSNTVTGFVCSNYATFDRCISHSNTGGSSHGFDTPGGAAINCVAYANGGKGFTGSDDNFQWINCIAESNTGIGFSTTSGGFLINCAAFSNTGGNTSLGTVVTTRNYNFVTGVSSFFTNAAGADFSLNNTASAGAAARAAGFPGVLQIGGTGFLDIGTLQHADPVSSGGMNIFAGEGIGSVITG